jgi:hypothetical protein
MKYRSVKNEERLCRSFRDVYAGGEAIFDVELA